MVSHQNDWNGVKEEDGGHEGTPRACSISSGDFDELADVDDVKKELEVKEGSEEKSQIELNDDGVVNASPVRSADSPSAMDLRKDNLTRSAQKQAHLINAILQEMSLEDQEYFLEEMDKFVWRQKVVTNPSALSPKNDVGDVVSKPTKKDINNASQLTEKLVEKSASTHSNVDVLSKTPTPSNINMEKYHTPTMAQMIQEKKTEDQPTNSNQLVGATKQKASQRKSGLDQNISDEYSGGIPQSQEFLTQVLEGESKSTEACSPVNSTSKDLSKTVALSQQTVEHDVKSNNILADNKPLADDAVKVLTNQAKTQSSGREFSVANDPWKTAGRRLKSPPLPVTSNSDGPYGQTEKIAHPKHLSQNKPSLSTKTASQMSEKVAEPIKVQQVQQPHKTLDTLSINETRTWITQLIDPLLNISSVIQENIRQLDIQKEQLEKSESIVELRQLVTIRITTLENIKLENPYIVCSSPKCVGYETINGTVAPIYRQVCHKEYPSVHAENEAELALHAAFKTENLCKKCGCGAEAHQRIIYQQKLKVVPVDNPQKFLENETNASKLKKRLVEKVDALRYAYNKELDYTLFGMARFSLFLTRNAITMSAKANIFKQRLEKLLDIELAKVSRVRDADRTRYNQLIQLLHVYLTMYEKQQKTIQHTSIEELQNIRQKLFTMSHFGSKIGEVFAINVDVDHQNFAAEVVPCNKSMRHQIIEMDPQSPPPSYEECMNSRPHTPQSHTYGSGGHQAIPMFQASPNLSCHNPRAVSSTPRVYRHGEQVIPIMVPEPPGTEQDLQVRREKDMFVGILKCFFYITFCIIVAVAFIFLKLWRQYCKLRMEALVEVSALLSFGEEVFVINSRLVCCLN
ncbi:unnamed protein product, partial [Mesorhabditis belari]|uniref:DUF8206 domain-containing protein n=1 Tax=Mesorhabditis belari TaxID=2138241 RepID=A0AAF3EI71_9BILA